MSPGMKSPKTALLGIFGLARRAKTLQIGQDIVKSSLARGEDLWVLFSNEEQSSFFRSLQGGNYRSGLKITVLSDISAKELSDAIGLKNVKVVALPLRSGFARTISQLLAEGGDYNE